MPLVPLTGQSRKARPRAASAPAQRSVSVGEIVLIWTTGWSGRSTVTRPSGPRIDLFHRGEGGQHGADRLRLAGHGDGRIRRHDPQRGQGREAPGHDVVAHHRVARGEEARGDGPAEEAQADDADGSQWLPPLSR